MFSLFRFQIIFEWLLLAIINTAKCDLESFRAYTQNICFYSNYIHRESETSFVIRPEILLCNLRILIEILPFTYYYKNTILFLSFVLFKKTNAWWFAYQQILGPLVSFEMKPAKDRQCFPHRESSNNVVRKHDACFRYSEKNKYETIK